jgi:4-amino-4-deoxy-L-arabinose transferase-like glycosyltransferase
MQLYSLGYPGILAIFYNLTGSGRSSTSEALGNGLLAKWVNLLFGLASLALVYAIARQLSTPRAARLAAVLFALWPAQLAFSSVLASEHLATLLALAGLAAAYPALKSDRIPAPAAGARLIAAGVCFALGAATRNTNLIILLAVLIALLFSPLKQPMLFKHRLAAAGLLLVAFASMTWLYREAIHARVRVYPTSTTAFSLLVGANYESGGLWNYADYDLMSQHPNIEVAKEFAWDEALRRITGQPVRFLQLTISKVVVLWQDDGYSIFWSTQKLSPERSPEETQPLIRQFTSNSQPFHAAVWILATAAAVFLLRRPTGRMNIIAMTLLGSTLMHSILEVQNRYAYWMMPLLFILAAVGWAEFFQRERLSGLQANLTGPAPVNSLADSPELEGRTLLRY